MKKAALAACSNGLAEYDRQKIERLTSILREAGIGVVESPYLYRKDGFAAGSAKARAEAVNRFYRDESIDTIFDLSGGDMANEVLPYLDFELIRKNKKVFFGYSDLTTILNALSSQSGSKSVLFQVKHLVSDQSGIQIERFRKWLQGDNEMFEPTWTVLQGDGSAERMLKECVVVGGNIRCFLKLAGTKYFPELKDKILFLEARSGGVPQISAYMAWLSQIGAFEQVKAVLLGTFTELERMEHGISAHEIMKVYLPEGMFVAKTAEIGHANDSKALWIG